MRFNSRYWFGLVALFFLNGVIAHAQSTVTLPPTAFYEVILTWDAPVNSTDPVAGYDAFRAPSGGTSYQLINVNEITLTTYTDTTVAGGTTYDYIVESVDASGVTSGPSNVASVTIPVLTTPNPPVIGALHAT